MSTPLPRSYGRLNARGVWTLYRREILRSLKIWNITIAAPALQAVLMALVFTLIVASMPHNTLPSDYFGFLIPGLVAAAILERAYAATAFSVVYDKLEGVIADLLIAPLTPGEIVVAYASSAFFCP